MIREYPRPMTEPLMLRVRLGRLATSAPSVRARNFHVKRAARDAIGFPGELFAARGDVVFANPYAAHLFTAAVESRRSVPDSDRLRPAEVMAMAVVHEVYHAVVDLYRREHPAAFGGLQAALRERLGSDFEGTLRAFVAGFPPPAVYQGQETVERVLAGPGGVEEYLEEILLLWLANQNPAYAPIAPLVGDDELRRGTAYESLIAAARADLGAAPAFGPLGEPLLEVLLAPIRHSPTSIMGQIAFMKERWGLKLTELGLLDRLLHIEDVVREEANWFERRAHGVAEPAPAAPPRFTGELYEEPERFSADLDWMPRVVLIAKSTFVWLDQLSRRYGRTIATLGDIPDEELDLLAARGLNALWLIGLWRRSRASQRIKQRMGNPDAAPSAYSLDDYEIAPELGGDQAYRSLRDRAARRGIRLASDMVPNHMGIDSTWVIRHPDRFLQVRTPPFPGYSFDGPDVGDDGRVGIFLEDGYWTHRDAAVVFKRLDRETGDVRYLYHGNDGTSMPWNDTAQLNYLNAEVREAVMQTILHVARLFPIIRFDAAMTLAKRHYQRLWFPLPGTGGAIPSRAEHALPRERFEELFPVEFWREVVDRVAREAPDTLLLAEAFWMMEGYFVRTLGMHRVYNSAFMNMLKREDNGAFRTTIKNVLQFEPQILKRFVNFMNNPDEEPAIEQFGRDDKYFGVCTLMCTLPGLPMFGHGQIEGFAEKYGMEFRRASRAETPDADLIARHEREIFPLLRSRWLFSDVDGFRLYDFVTEDGQVNEDVIAYSNRVGEARALVVFHNRWAETRGRLHRSVAAKGTDGALRQTTLAEGLDLAPAPDRFARMRDYATGLELLVATTELAERGLFVELGAFKYRVLLDLRLVESSAAAPWADLAGELGQRAVPSLDAALRELRLRAVHLPYRAALDARHVAYLRDAGEAEAEAALVERFQHIVDGLAYLGIGTAPTADILELARARLARLRALDPLDAPLAQVLNAWIVTAAIRALVGPPVEELELPAACALALGDAAAATLVDLLVASAATPGPVAALRALLARPEARRFIGAHEADGTIWFVREPFTALAAALVARAAVEGLKTEGPAEALADLEQASGYRLAPLLAALDAAAPDRAPSVKPR